MNEKKPFQISKPWFYLILSLAVISLATVVGLVIYFTYNSNLTKKVVINEQTPTNTINDIVTSTQDNEPVSGEEIKVEWYKGAKKATDEEIDKIIFSKAPELKRFYTSEPTCDYESENSGCSLYLYKVGLIKSPEDLAGKELLLILSYYAEMGSGFNTALAFYNSDNGDLIKIGDDYSTAPEKLFSGSILPPETLNQFNEVGPHIFTLQNGSILFINGYLQAENQTVFSQFGAPQNFGGILDVAKGFISPTSYSADKIVFNDDKYGPVYFVNNIYRYIMPDGSNRFFDLLPYFFENTSDQLASIKESYGVMGQVKINWIDKQINYEPYELSGDIGQRCGPFIEPNTNIINNNNWFNVNKLVAIGETKKGDKVYELSDKATNSYYKDIFEMGYDAAKLYPTINGETDQTNYDEWYTKLENMTNEEKYTDFINDKPLFFWKDHMNNWRVYKKAKYRTLAECGKPVIYLYPETEININVQVKPNAGFSKTEPIYPENGWLVKSSVNSDIYNYADNITYPYLFWEGNAYNFITPDYGFVMSKDEVETRMNEILGKLGLNQKEIKDFMEFWQPKLEVKPYVFVTFLPQREFDKIAPLTVNPKPDTVIRVMMDYMPLDAPIEAKEPRIKTPERIGFTVVEWGGRLYN